MKRKRSLAGGAFALLMLGAPAGFAAGSVELLHRSRPPVSDTASGATLRQLPFRSPLRSRSARTAATPSSSAARPTWCPASGTSTARPASPATGRLPRRSRRRQHDPGQPRHGLPATTGNKGSGEAVISADGRWVVFLSAATDLVPGQRGHFPFTDDDVLLYDRMTGATTLVAATQPGAGQLPAPGDQRRRPLRHLRQRRL